MRCIVDGDVGNLAGVRARSRHHGGNLGHAAGDIGYRGVGLGALVAKPCGGGALLLHRRGDRIRHVREPVDGFGDVRRAPPRPARGATGFRRSWRRSVRSIGRSASPAILTSEATTEKPRPASPARAASIVALSASRLVCSAIALITPDDLADVVGRLGKRIDGGARRIGAHDRVAARRRSAPHLLGDGADGGDHLLGELGAPLFIARESSAAFRRLVGGRPHAFERCACPRLSPQASPAPSTIGCMPSSVAASTSFAMLARLSRRRACHCARHRSGRSRAAGARACTSASRSVAARDALDLAARLAVRAARIRVRRAAIASIVSAACAERRPRPSAPSRSTISAASATATSPARSPRKRRWPHDERHQRRGHRMAPTARRPAATARPQQAARRS